MMIREGGGTVLVDVGVDFEVEVLVGSGRKW